MHDQRQRDPLRSEPAFLDTAGAARLLGVSTKHMQNLRVSGEGPAFFRFGDTKAVRYGREDLLGWAGARRVTSTSQVAEADQ